MALNIFKKKQMPEEKAEVLGKEEELPELPELEELPELPELEEGLPELEEKPEEELELPPLPEEELPEIPAEIPEEATPEVGEFKEGFRHPEELKPPSFRPRELPRRVVELSRQPQARAPFAEITAGTMPGPVQAPHIYLKITKYKEVLGAVHDLHKSILETKQDMEELNSIGKEEEEKLKESANVVLQIEDLISKLEMTFRQPEE
jgi:hypothetical protein